MSVRNALGAATAVTLITASGAFAETLTIPLASISNVTSTWGTPLGAGGIPVKSNCPRF